MLFFADRFTWLTPSWLIATGVLLGMLVLLALWGAAALVNRRAGRWCWEIATEGMLFPLLITAGLISVYSVAILAAGLVFESKQLPVAAFSQSLRRILAQDDQIVRTIDLAPSQRNLLVEFDANPLEIEKFTIEAPGDAEMLLFLPNEPGFNILQPSVVLDPQKPWPWKRTLKNKYFFSGDRVQFYLINNTNLPNPVEVTMTATAEYPQVKAIPITAAIVVAGVLAYAMLWWAFPRILAVAGTTLKETIYQPLFFILLILTIGLIFFPIFVPLNTFGEDIKSYKENTLTLLTVVSLLLAIWSASNTIADEIEGRTALTVLSKPISRLQFVVGKYLGVIFPVLILFIIGSVFFLGCLPYKTVYDARESSQLEPTWQQGFEEIRLIVPGLALTLMEIMTLTSISVAISTRLPMLVNLLISGTIYVLGHLLPLLVLSSRISSDYNLDKLVEFSARFFATVLPVLENYNIHAAITGGSEVPWSYLGVTLLYTICYCAFALVVSLLLFEDRDLS